MLNVFYKIFTYILNSRLALWCSDHGKIPENQAGFRKGYSTNDNIFTLHSIIQRRLHRTKGKCYCLFVDFSQAFDSVPRDKLLNKLFTSGINGKMYGILKSINETIRACIRAGNFISDFFNCPIGLRQGCLLSPLKFAIFISILSDLIDSNDSCGIQLFPALTMIKSLFYADDVVFFSDTIGGLQKHIDTLSSFCKQWGMKVNLSKTKVIVFRKGGRLSSREKWFYDGHQLEVVSSYKYLGLTLSTGNCWGKAANILAEQAMKVLNILKRAMVNAGDLSCENYFKIFDAVILPMLLYGSEVIGFKRYECIEKVQYKACKQFLGVSQRTTNNAVLGECGRYPIFTLQIIRCIKYWLRLLSMDNSRFPKKSYLMLVYLDETGKVTWATQIKLFLFSNGFGHAWLNQGVGSEILFIDCITQRVKDISQQDWFTDICTQEKLRTYREFKGLLECEKYLLLVNRNQRRYLAKLRCSDHVLKVETDRRLNIDAHERYCELCTNGCEDEYHFVLLCDFFHDLRVKFIPSFFRINPSYEKFIILLKSKNSCNIMSLTQYVYHAMKLREVIEYSDEL